MRWVEELYDQVAKAGVGGGVQCALKNRNGVEYIEIWQAAGAVRTVYWVCPWTPDPQIPVLYFNVYDRDELVVKVDEVYRLLVPEQHYEELGPTHALSRGSISQGEHPGTGLPAFYIHPCNTGQLLDHLDTDSGLLLWLKWFGQRVGLNLDIDI